MRKINAIAMKEMRKIVVMGGSFNPPTLAHYKLMKCAIDTLAAYKGIFVPVSDAYLKRKMRGDFRPIILSPEVRIAMLEAICTEEERMGVDTLDIGTIEARTVPTLHALQRKNPDAELYFIMGDDKLPLLEHLTKTSGFLDYFRTVLFSRESGSIEAEIEGNSLLATYSNRIVILSPPEDIKSVSSSLIRENFLSGVSCEALLHPAVWRIFSKFVPEQFPVVINRFKGNYSFLANNYPCKFIWRGVKYSSAEVAAKALGCGEDIELMTEILTAKFGQNSKLMQLLLDTGSSVLINGTNNNQTFWGVDRYSWMGENNLGKILMNIRNKEK